MDQPALLALADGTVFQGRAIGAVGQQVGEVVFNTAMTGYQEILTDPSYCRQIVALTYPQIGNTGVNDEDAESADIAISGLVIRDLPRLTSSWRAESSLQEYCQQRNIIALADIDTRRLTRILREKGAQNGCIWAGDDLDEQVAVAKARQFGGLAGLDLAQQVTTSAAYQWQSGCWSLASNSSRQPASDHPAAFHVVAYDFGVKHNILRMLVERDCRVTVVPAQTPAQTVLEMHPDGVFLSNGPGDPAPCDYAIEAIQALLAAKIPLFGICLGHQLLALACGAQTVKMKFGHHGANHPVVDLATQRVMITSQNHGFAVDEASLPATLRATHRSLFDGSLQGIAHTTHPAFSFQGHPEASPGPQDAAQLFDDFIGLMQAQRGDDAVV